MVSTVRPRADLDSLPGGELVARGLADLRAKRETQAALAVSMATGRLRAAGVDVPGEIAAEPSHALYDLLARDDPDGAHGRYSALVAQIVSFARAVEAEHAASR